MSWPDDADGDVLRRLKDLHVDFDQVHSIEFVVEFERWPVMQDAMEDLHELYDDVVVVEPDKEEIALGQLHGFVLVILEAQLSYEFVVGMQSQLTRQLQRYGGRCESWEVEAKP